MRSGLTAIAVLGVAACENRTTGVWQLPTPPQRDVASFTQLPPTSGPTVGKTNDCKQGDTGYRLDWNLIDMRPLVLVRLLKEDAEGVVRRRDRLMMENNLMRSRLRRLLSW